MSEREGVRGLVAVREVLAEMRERQVARRFKSQTLVDWADRIEAALAAEGVQAGEVSAEVKIRARELLAQAFEMNAQYVQAAFVRKGCGEIAPEKVAIAAIVAALSQQPEARGAVDVEAIRRACESGKRFWKSGPGYYEEIESLLPALTEARNVR